MVRIEITTVRDALQVLLRNPYQGESTHHGGNRMALANIRERLQLHFDAEASLTTRVGKDDYEVRIVMPYTRAGAEEKRA